MALTVRTGDAVCDPGRACSLVLDWHRPVVLVETKHPVTLRLAGETSCWRCYGSCRTRLRRSVPCGGDRFGGHRRSGGSGRGCTRCCRRCMNPDTTNGVAVRATAVGPLTACVKGISQLVDRSAAQGRAVYCWNITRTSTLPEVEGGLVGTHRSRTKAWLEDGRANGPSLIPARI